MIDQYKLTEFGDIPKEWRLIKLSSILIDAKLGGNYENGEVEVGLPLIKMGNISRGRIVLNKIEYVPIDLVYSNEYVLKEGDLLLNTRNTAELVGKVAVWRNELKTALFNSNLLRMKFDEKQVESNYFMNYVFNSSYGISQLRSFATGTTSVAAIYNKDLLKFKVILPPLVEQQKIAEILSTVDKKIELIDAQISHTQELKRGLKQQLLTKGIGHTQFKSSVLGDIPESWNVAELRDLLSDMKSGLSRKLSMQDIGIPVIRSNNLDAEQVTFDDLKYWYLNDPKGAKTSDYYLKDGDILISFINSLAQIGKSAMFFNKINRDIIYTTNILKLTANNTVSNHFIYYCTKTEQFKKFVQLITKPAVNQASFTTKDFQRYKIALPPLIEQEQIATILNTVDEKMNVLLVKKAEYWQLKNGLMQQLLTGKIRVNSYQEASAVA